MLANFVRHIRSPIARSAIVLLMLAACSGGDVKPPAADAPAAKAVAAAPEPAPPPPPAAPPPPPPIPVVAHDEAVLKAANDLFSKAQLPAEAGAGKARFALVVDPLVDGVSRMQTATTRKMEARITQLARTKYPQFDVKPFTAANLAQSPLLIVGTFTPINLQGKSEGPREAYRFCLAMVDLKSGTVVSKAVTRSQMEEVDPTPLQYFRDAPVWAKDAPAEAYVATCQASKLGGVVNSAYIDGMVAAALIDEGIRAYNAARYKDALAVFTKAQATPAGNQLRTLNGVYLAAHKLGRRDQSTQAFARIVDFGLDAGRLSVMFTFRPGATSLRSDAKTAPHDMWLKSLAQRAAQREACMEVVGHASRGGPEAVNERLSALRAEHVRQRLVDEAPALAKRLLAAGYGSRENQIGTGKDDASDALDRRVEFRLLTCQG